MFGFGRASLPITAEQKEWVDRSLVRLAGLVGAARLTEAETVLPTAEYFPDPYDRSEEALRRIFRRVALWMEVEPESVELTMFASTEETTRGLVPFGSSKTSGAGGLYFHEPEVRAQISVNESQMKDPMSLVATLAHELGHVILLRPGLVGRDEADMEPLNDLLTVFLGFGIFSANAAFRFEQHTNNNSQGWSTRRLGYLSEEQFGYALARYAFERGETKPEWRSLLSTNVAVYMKRSSAWLADTGALRLLS
jgi:hypothetical protein